MILGTKEKLVRFSFCNVFEPKAILDSEPKFSVQILIPKKFTDLVAAVKKEITEAQQQGVKKGMFTQASVKNGLTRQPLRDGDQEAATTDDGKKDYLKGHMFFNASAAANRPPTVVDRRLQPIMNAAEFYSGCYGCVDVNFFAFKFGKGGVAAGLNSIMKREDGERMDGMVPAEKAFAAVADEPGDDSDDDDVPF